MLGSRTPWEMLGGHLLSRSLQTLGHLLCIRYFQACVTYPLNCYSVSEAYTLEVVCLLAGLLHSVQADHASAASLCSCCLFACFVGLHMAWLSQQSDEQVHTGSKHDKAACPFMYARCR